MEQDRRDAIPHVLNDLEDVDGSWQVGDTLVYDGENWVSEQPTVWLWSDTSNPNNNDAQRVLPEDAVLSDLSYNDGAPAAIYGDPDDLPCERVSDVNQTKFSFTRPGVYEFTGYIDEGLASNPTTPLMMTVNVFVYGIARGHQIETFASNGCRADIPRTKFRVTEPMLPYEIGIAAVYLPVLNTGVRPNITTETWNLYLIQWAPPNPIRSSDALHWT